MDDDDGRINIISSHPHGYFKLRAHSTLTHIYPDCEQLNLASANGRATAMSISVFIQELGISKLLWILITLTNDEKKVIFKCTK